MENRAPQNMKKNDLLDLINNAVDGIQTQHDKATQLTNEMEECKKKANGYLAMIQGQKQKTDELSTEKQKQYGIVKNLNTEIAGWHTDSKTCISEIQKQQKKVNELSSEIQKQKETADSDISEIQKQQKNALELTNKIKEQHDTDLNIIREKQKEYEQLNKKIEGLLPGATSAGLAGSYHDAQIEQKTKGYWWGFISSLLILIVIYISFLISQEMNWTHIITRTIIGAPLLWIAWYCQRSISQTKRIKEEYHHKERIMAVFDGFSKEIDRLTEDDPKQNKVKKLELISVIIEAIRKNPAETIKPSDFLLDSLKIEKKVEEE